MRKRVTIRDVAKAAGVSLATVSYVMNDLDKVSPEVDRLVRRVARDLGYARNRAAASLKTGRHNVIGCILPTLVSPIFPEIAEAVQSHAETKGLATLLINSGDTPLREAKALRMLADHGVDGAIAVLHPGFDAEGQRPPFPLVTLDSPLPGHDCLQADHVGGGRLIAEHALRLGHRRIGLLSGDETVASSRERRRGFLQAAAGQCEVVWEETVPLTASLGPNAQRSLARRDVSLVVCVNDLVAIGALSALRDLGIDVPGEVSVIGFDDIGLSAWPLIGLSTVRQSVVDLGRGAVERLLGRIAGDSSAPSTIVLPVSLVERATTAAHPASPDDLASNRSRSVARKGISRN
ncbi:LacI family DNA-binding transcriptional regulator [Salipiger sp. 1_MG-2023]|uniref:LacI family DNA-binding transcriptional regulator n=1 Tax=Salipiger sp. 1_MG-2023 TaxID=3062665 RepID=UPI0026E42157|nr:LacI family DNA-binding transcriptional regulator [Salipiger sp. 1_MG-2023]MDO6587827.1 LacI family DNA-binding transcriptional regulator [Salipiger sp. 1_MG-2023]